jgi:Kef-type K+ transport system membrane component KefB/nucleotide-binding universal stress UspA family protein
MKIRNQPQVPQSPRVGEAAKPASSPFLAACLWSVGLFGLGVGNALAAASSTGPSEVVFLAQLLVLMAVGRLLGEAMQRIGQPSVMGQLLAGIMLGPSVLGWLWPDLQQWIFPASKDQKSMIDAISQWGILLLLLLTGMETDLKLVRKVGRAAISVSLTGVAVPFAFGATLGWFMPESLLPDANKRLLTALFLGTALSISSIKIVAAVVREMNFMRRNLGQVIVASAIMEDTIGWIIVAITFSLAEAGAIDPTSVAKSVVGTAAFLVVSFTIGRRIVFYCIRWANDHFESEFPVITTILVIMGMMALTTHFIGVHTVLGAFVSGVLIGESPILTKHIDEQLRGLIMAFFMPVFFGMAGLSTDLTILKDPQLVAMALGLIAIASIGKFTGAFIGGEIGGLTRREVLALACGMNARGSTEVIVATIGLSMGALTQNLFTMIVAMAVTTTMIMPPMLRWGLSRVPITKSEKARLEREEIEAKGFVPNLERILLAVDDSANGRFASRLAGLLAGPRGISITVLPLATNSKQRPASKAAEDDMPKPEDDNAATTKAKENVRAAAEEGKTIQPEEEKPVGVDVIVRPIDAAGGEAVAREAEKGYDLLFVGLGKMRAKNGGFDQDVFRIIQPFDGPLAIVAAHGDHLNAPEKSPLHMLVPVNGTEVSRRAAEVAITAARVVGAPITALYVSNVRPDARGRRSRRMRTPPHEQAILKEIVELADQYDLKIKTAVRAGITPDDAILMEIKRNKHDLIVLGVSRRPGEKLFFGDTATAVFEKAPASILIVTT